MNNKKHSEIEAIILDLLTKKNEITLHEVALQSDRSPSDESDRKYIRRILSDLVDRKIIKAEGATRARIYRLLTQINNTEMTKQFFKEIELSRASNKLLKYLSSSHSARSIVSYNQNFLRSYIPNKTFYLTISQREELQEIGAAENNVRPAGTYARHILDRLLVDLSWNSSRLEGNTYSLLETKRLIERGENAAGKDISETQMILNHKSAIEYIVESASDLKITSHVVCSLHALLSENLLGDSSASGRLRRLAVGISGTSYMPLDNPHILKECFELFIKKLNLIKNPFEQSFFALVHLSYLQAFEDVNKRTARLVANIPLIRENFRPLSFTDVEQPSYVKSLLGIYEKNDFSLMLDLYMWAYKRSSQKYSAIQQSMGEPNRLKLKYRDLIHEIIRNIILLKVHGKKIVPFIKNEIKVKKLDQAEAAELFHLIELEILALHDGNIARFKIRPSEYLTWKKLNNLVT
jgi:Fic family protein/predicted transcriptional regulator